MTGRRRASLIVVAYDVADDRVRDRVARVLLETGGRRVQRSVFELETDAESLSILRRRLARLRGAEDSIAYYRLCRACRRQTIYAGPGARSEEGDGQ